LSGGGRIGGGGGRALKERATVRNARETGRRIRAMRTLLNMLMDSE